MDSLGNDEKFNTNEKRLENREQLIKIINNEFKKYPSDILIKKLQKHGIPCAKVNKISDLIIDKQLSYRNMIKEISTPNGMVKLLDSPIKMSETPGTIRSYPPKLGENTTEILKNLGLDERMIKELFSKKIVL